MTRGGLRANLEVLMAEQSNRRRAWRLLIVAGVAVGIGVGTAGVAAAKPGPPGGGGGSSIEYSFTFVNGTTITGTSTSNTASLPDAGGTSADNPTGMLVHVSCSDPFTGGWGVKNGPNQVTDSAWQIASYSIVKGSKTCSGNFVPTPTGDPKIDIEMYVNGDDADTPTGPTIEIPGTANFTYVVTNNGKQALRNVVVTDERLGAVTCPKTTLAVGEVMNCTPRSTSVSTAGAKTSSATVTGVADVVAPTAAAPADSKSVNYVFVFRNGKVVTGTATSNTATVSNAGGTSADNPTGMLVHVSCSDPFTGGWGVKNGPNQVTDSAWQIASYSIAKKSKTCGSTFFPVTRTVTDNDPVNYLAKTVTPPPTVKSSLGDRVWIDETPDGRQDRVAVGQYTEPGLPGAKVTLLTPNGARATDITGATVAVQTTDANGLYRFRNLKAGSYVVEFETPCNFQPTKQNVPNDDYRDSDVASITPVNGRCLARTGTIVLPAGFDDFSVDFGLVSGT
jgi:hypothetical protein